MCVISNDVVNTYIYAIEFNDDLWYKYIKEIYGKMKYLYV